MARSPELARLFQQPDLPAQRPYEICRAYFHEAITADEIAQQFHLHVGSVRAIVCDFARDPAAKGPPWRTSTPRSNAKGSTSANRTSSGSCAAQAWPRLAKVVPCGNPVI